MDKGTLVRELLDGGEKLVARLVKNGVGVSAAGWVETTEAGEPQLYIVAPLADEQGLFVAYGALADAMNSLESEWSHWLERIDDSSIRMCRTTEPLARGLIDVTQRSSAKFPTWFGSPSLGGVSIDGAYLYPPTLLQPQPQPAAG